MKIVVKAKNILAELDQAKIDRQLKVPVKMAGMFVGWATFDDDHNITLDISPGAKGRELREILTAMSAPAISLNPTKF